MNSSMESRILGVAVGGWWLVYAAFIFKTSIYFMTKSTYVMSYMYGISNLCVSIPGIYIGIRVALGYGCGRLALGCLSAFLTFAVSPLVRTKNAFQVHDSSFRLIPDFPSGFMGDF